MKRTAPPLFHLFLAATAFWVVAGLPLPAAAVELALNGTITEDFDGIGTSANATLPTGWTCDTQTTRAKAGIYSETVTLVTDERGGDTLSASATNGAYNFGSGDPATDPDRCIGFLASGASTKSGNLYAKLNNNTGSEISSLTIGYDVEKYRMGENADTFIIQLWYSTDGYNWSDAGSDFLTSYPTDGTTSGYQPAPGVTTSMSGSLNVTIASGNVLYLLWQYTTESSATTTFSQAIAVDSVAITAIGPPITFIQADVDSGPMRHGTADSNTVYAACLWSPADSISEVVVYNGGTATSTDVPQLQLWLDNNGDSNWTASDSWVGTLAWNGANNYYGFSGGVWIVNQVNGSGGLNGESFPFVVTAEVGDTSAVTDGRTFWAWINGPEYGMLADTGPKSFPALSDTNAYLQEINTELRSAELGAVVVSPDTVVRGQTNKLMIAVRLPGDGTGGYVLNDISVAANGTLTPTTDYTLDLWDDDGDGNFSASSDTSYALTWDVDHWEDAGANLGVGIDGAGETLFLTCSFTAAGALHEGVELQLTSGVTVFTTDPFVTNNLTSSVTSGLVSLCPLVLLNEVCPTPSDAAAEFVELYNPNDLAIDLNSWGFFLGEGPTQEYQFPSGASVASKGVYLIALNANAYAGEFPEAPRPDAEWDTTASGGDSSAIADMIFTGSAIMGLGSGGDEVYLRITASAGIDEFVYDGYTATSLPEDIWTGTPFGALSAGQSAGRNRDGVEGAESAGSNSEDLTSGFSVTGMPTPGRLNYYLKIMDIGNISDGAQYFNLGIYQTNGDTYTVANGADTAVTLTASSASCTFSGATVGTITSGEGTNEVVINPASGAIRLLVTDVANEVVVVGASVQWGNFLAWYDTATFTFLPTAQAVISEVAPSEATPFIELYVTSGGSGAFKDGVRIWDGNNENGSETLAGLTALITGDYIVIHDGFGANETTDSGGNSYWDVYWSFNLTSTTEDAAEFRDTDGKIDAVFYGPGSTELSQADITLISPAIEAGLWSVEGDTVKYPDWVHHRASAGYSVSRDSVGSDTHSKYGWSTTTISEGSASTTFQQYAGIDTAVVEPTFVYPGATNQYFLFTFTNTSGAAAISGGSFLALEAPPGYPAIHGASNDNFDSGILVTDGVAANYDTLIIRAGTDTQAYLALTSSLTNFDTIGFVFGDTVTGLNVPAGSDTDYFKVRSDLWGTSVRDCSNAAVYRVYPDTCTLSQYSAGNLWGTRDDIVVTPTFCGNPIAGVPVNLMITSKTGDGVDQTSLEIGGIVYNSYWSDTTVYTGRDGTVTFILVTDSDDSGANTVMITVSNSASSTVSETFSDNTVSPTVLFNEIMYNPDDAVVTDANGEWFELVNTTGDTIDLGGWVLKESGATDFTVPSDYALIGPYGYAVVAIDTSATGFFAAAAGYSLTGSGRLIQWTGMSLANTGGMIGICQGSDTRDVVNFSNSWGADGNGLSLSKANPSATSDASGNWNDDDSDASNPFTANYGTPGFVNCNAVKAYSVIEATGATANGTDTATITVSLVTPDRHPVLNHQVTIFGSSGNLTLTSPVGTTDNQGQYTCSATSTTVGNAQLGVACTAEDSAPVSDTATVRFYTASGFANYDADTYLASISSVNTIKSTDYAAGPTDTWALICANWSLDGTRLSFLEGDFSTVKGNPGSNRGVYYMSPTGGATTRVSSISMNPCPYGRAAIGDIDNDGAQEMVFSGYVTSYAMPFWGVFSAPLDGSATGVGNPEAYHISPAWSYSNAWTPDITTWADAPANPSDGGYPLNLACNELGDVIIYSGKWAKETPYFSRTSGSNYMRRILRGYACGMYPLGNARNPLGQNYRASYWAEPTWSPDGKHLALVRMDLREAANGGADTAAFQSEIWVLKNVADFVKDPVNLTTDPADTTSVNLVRISPQTIQFGNNDEVHGDATDPADTWYFNPQWSRDGKVISYAYDRNGTFNFQIYASGPNAAFANTNFDVAMKYVGNLDDTGLGADGMYYDTYPEQVVMAGEANEFYMAWSPAGASQLAAVYWDSAAATAALRTFDIQSEAYISENGGILFDNGVVTAVVGADDTFAQGTVIRVSEPSAGEAPAAEHRYDTMFATGAAREFWPHGWQSSDPIMVILHYDVDDLLAVGLTDGDPQESSLKVWYYDNASSAWVDYGGVVDTVNNTITFFTTHFSHYAIFFERNPSPAQSSLILDKAVALADGIDGAMFTVTLKDDSGLPIPNVPVEFATSRGETIAYVNSLTGADGKLYAYVKSSEPGTTVVRCSNLDAIFTETYPIEFVTPRSSEGLISSPALPGVYVYVPLGAFDTEVGFTLSAGPGTALDLFNQATERSRQERSPVSFLPDLNAPDVVTEFHAKRASDGASMDTAFLLPLRLMFDVPAGLNRSDFASLSILLLDQNDEDTDGVTAEWIEYPTSYDEAQDRFWTELRHFSIYRLGARGVDVPGLNDVRIYPNPWRSDRHATNANPGIKILLPVNRAFTIKVYTLAGDLVDAEAVNTTGGAGSYGYVWDLNNAAGQPVASGVYFVIIRDSNSGETTVKKVAVIR